MYAHAIRLPRVRRRRRVPQRLVFAMVWRGFCLLYFGVETYAFVKTGHVLLAFCPPIWAGTYLMWTHLYRMWYRGWKRGCYVPPVLRFEWVALGVAVCINLPLLAYWL
jgi:hypothetical protein